jgi:hypothetical protein
VRVLVLIPEDVNCISKEQDSSPASEFFVLNDRTLEFKLVVVILAVNLVVQILYLNIQKMIFL